MSFSLVQWFSYYTFAYEKWPHDIAVNLLANSWNVYFGFIGPKPPADFLTVQVNNGGGRSNESVTCQLAEQRKHLSTPPPPTPFN